MRAIIPSLSVKGFQAVLSCLAKIGDDIIVEARPDRFILSTMNITRSAYASFSFTRTFFESYHLDTSADAIKHDAVGPYLRSSVLAKALVSACKVRGNVEQKIEKCCLFMNSAEGVGENCRLTVEIIFKYGFIKIHKLLYESCPEPIQVDDVTETCPSSWRLQPAALIGFADNFSPKAEEISMTCTQEGVTFKTAKDTSEEESGVVKRIGTTVVPMSRAAMEQYKLQDDIELTFSMKEFKAIIAFAVTLRLPLEGHFDARSRPFLLTVQAENIVCARFALATVMDDSEDNEHPNGGQSGKMEDVKPGTTHTNSNGSGSRAAAHTDLDLTQPENALFLDDDADWAGALDDLEMEEAAAAAAAAAVAQGTAGAAGGSSSGVTRNDRESAYEIEEAFLPATQREPKRRKFNFDEDD